MSSPDTRQKSFAIATLLVISFLIFALLYRGLVGPSEKVISENTKSESFLLTNEQIEQLAGHLAAIQKAAEEDLDKALDEAKKLKQETKTLQDGINQFSKEVEQFSKEVEQFSKEVEQLRIDIEKTERLLCEKGMLKDCKSI